MAVAYRSKTFGGAASGTGFTASEPSGAAQNDILFMWVTMGSGGTSINKPSGWNELFLGNLFGTAVRCYLFWIRRGASAPSYAMSWTGTIYFEWSVSAWSGCETSGNPYSDAQYNAPTTRQPCEPDCPQVATGVANTIVIAFGMGWAGCQASSYTVPTGYTAVELGSTGQDACVAYKAVASAGNENPPAFTNGSANLDEVIECTVAIKPPAAAPVMSSWIGNFPQMRRATKTEVVSY